MNSTSNEDINPQDFDKNWYFVDRHMHLICVASGGGPLPDFIMRSMRDNDSIHSNMLAIEGLFESARTLNIKEYIVWPELGEEDYYRTFDLMAQRGFYVYDKIVLAEPKDSKYILVAYPKRIKWTENFEPSPVLPYLLLALGKVARLDNYRKKYNKIPVFDVPIVTSSTPKANDPRLYPEPIEIVNIVNRAKPLY